MTLGTIKDELKQYQTEPPIYNTLTFWGENAKKYASLSIIAKRIAIRLLQFQANEFFRPLAIHFGTGVQA